MDTFSCNSSAQKHVSFDHHADHGDDDDDDDDQDQDQDQDQESGWTTYLKDFSNHRGGIDDRDQDHRMSSGNCVLGAGASLSLVSDAATGRKGCQQVIAGCSPATGSVSFPNKLKFGKARKICEDDSLEDTASSPANSPKVSHLDEQLPAAPTKVDNYIGTSYVMGNGRVEDQSREGGDDGERSINNDLNDDKNDLRSRGLCLVPISMLVKHNP